MRRIYFTIFLVSCSALIFEVSLTRLFSISLSHHFAFMIISIAMLGIGSAGTALAVFSGLRNISNIAAYSALAGVSIIFGFMISNNIFFDPVKLLWDRSQIFYVALYCFVLSVPFFFSGMIVATAFSVQSEKSERIYGTDLLGASTGSLAVLGLLNIAGPEYAIFTASFLCFLASFISGNKIARWFVSLLIVINALILIFHPHFIHINLSSYKALPLALKYPGAEHVKTYYNSFSRIDSLKSPAVRFAPGLSLTYLEPLPEQVGLSIDGSEMNAVTKSQDRAALRFLSFLPSALAYEIMVSQKNIKGNENPPSPPFSKGGMGGFGNILVIDPKGGQQVLTAEYYGFDSIHKVESNPLLVKIIKEDLREFSGDIYKNNTWTGYGRIWLQSLRVKSDRFDPGGQDSGLLYDIIDLPLTGTSVSGVFGISEDYRFTVDAFKEYFYGLSRNGFINIGLYLLPPPRIELRILTTIMAALQQSGITEISNHVAAIRSWDSITILVKKSPFIMQEITIMREFCKNKRFDLVYYPGIKEEETNLYTRIHPNNYYKNFQSIIDPATGKSFVEKYLFDIAPVYDDNPFFNYYLRLKNIKVIYDIMGSKLQYFIQEGYLIPVIFAQILLLSVILIVLPVVLKKVYAYIPKIKSGQPESDESCGRRSVIPTLVYFAMLGTGFMMVEVTMIQKSILPLENPSYAVATALTAILISSGAGSMLSSKFRRLNTLYLLPVLAGLISIYSLLYPSFLHLIAPYHLELKILLIFISLTPLGFFMGIPFPTGMKLLGQIHKTLIPWAWVVNGCLSVLAPVLTMMFAMTVGFKAVLWLGTLAYLIAFVSLWKMMKVCN